MSTDALQDDEDEILEESLYRRISSYYSECLFESKELYDKYKAHLGTKYKLGIKQGLFTTRKPDGTWRFFSIRKGEEIELPVDYELLAIIHNYASRYERVFGYFDDVSITFTSSFTCAARFVRLPTLHSSRNDVIGFAMEYENLAFINSMLPND